MNTKILNKNIAPELESTSLRCIFLATSSRCFFNLYIWKDLEKI